MKLFTYDIYGEFLSGATGLTERRTSKTLKLGMRYTPAMWKTGEVGLKHVLWTKVAET